MSKGKSMTNQFLSVLVLVALPAALSAGVIYNVSLDTGVLAVHPAGPFSIAFQLADGSFTGDGNNAAILEDFDFGVGGSATGTPSLMGGAFGSLSTSVTLTDATPINFFSQTFTPGDRLSFSLFMTTNLDGGPLPDQFIFYILDNTGNPIPTTAGEYFDALIAFTIDSDNPSPQVYQGDTGRSPVAGGDPIGIGPAELSSPVPEPGTLGMVGAAAVLLLLGAKRGRSIEHRRT